MIEPVKKGIEAKIKNYFNYNDKIDNLMAQLEKKQFEGSPKDITAVDLTSVGHGSSKRQSAERVLNDVQKLQVEIQNLRYEYKIINSALNIMKKDSPMEYKFIVEYYKEGKDLTTITLDLGYSLTSRKIIYKMRDNIIEKFKNFGLE